VLGTQTRAVRARDRSYAGPAEALGSRVPYKLACCRAMTWERCAQSEARFQRETERLLHTQDARALGRGGWRTTPHSG
jgi:hypothetical protein